MIGLKIKSIEKLKQEKGISLKRSKRIIEGSIQFLEMCGRYDIGFVPSKLIDEGWHIMILHTKDYQDWCKKKFGIFMHHEPNFRGRLKTTSFDTVKFMKKHGIKYDKDLWEGRNKSGACSPCFLDGCDSIPKNNKPCTPYCGKGCRCNGMLKSNKCSGCLGGKCGLVK